MQGLFSKLMQLTMSWARHRHATRYLAGVSFVESSFFPIPPDIMLAPMALAQPHRAWFYAAVTTVASVAGGVFGYVLGMFFFELIEGWLLASAYASSFEQAKQLFADYGFLAVVIAGFTPVPYKVFTVAAGALSMPLLPFVAASVVGRGGRFFLVAGLMKLGGARMEQLLLAWVDKIGWATVAVIGLVLAARAW